MLKKMTEKKLTQKEKDILVELISNEQIKYMIPNDGHLTKKYYLLEELKVKLKNI